MQAPRRFLLARGGNRPVSLWVCCFVGVWLVEQATTGYAIAGLLVGIAVLALAFPRGPKTESYGGWDPYVR